MLEASREELGQELPLKVKVPRQGSLFDPSGGL